MRYPRSYDGAYAQGTSCDARGADKGALPSEARARCGQVDVLSLQTAF
jgi:hypothetical protein